MESTCKIQEEEEEMLAKEKESLVFLLAILFSQTAFLLPLNIFKWLNFIEIERDKNFQKSLYLSFNNIPKILLGWTIRIWKLNSILGHMTLPKDFRVKHGEQSFW